MVVLSIFTFPGIAAARAELVLNTPMYPPYHYEDMSGGLDRFLTQAFARIDVDLRLQSLPAERSLMNANQGIGDGDAVRIAGLSALYPNLIQVPVVVNTMDFVAFSIKKRFTVTGWESLLPYDVGIVRGQKIAETNTARCRSVTPVDTVDQLFTLLKNGRVEVAVTERRFGEESVKALGLEGVKILEPALATLDFFVYLHRSHEMLVPRLAAVLRQMREEKLFERLMREREMTEPLKEKSR
jgi:polar amino acid transport system substrate-binding protein